MIPEDPETRLDLQTEFDKTESNGAPSDSTADILENQKGVNRNKATWGALTNHGLPDQQLLDLLADRFATELRNGKSPLIKEYQKADPKLADEIAEVLSSVAMIEDLKRQSETNSASGDRLGSLEIERLGDYRIIRELGRGGMGIVYEAVHESLGRTVAIKVLPSRLFGDPAALMRFQKEAQAAANLHHSNIVNVFGVGEANGLNYYVMEFVNGITFADIVRKLAEKKKTESAVELSATHRQSEEAIGAGLPEFKSEFERFCWSATLVSQIADALHYSHQQNILHRDIKPQNLMLDAEQKPWVTDFGLVKEITNQTQTKTGDLFGTPQYMAPESLDGKYDQRSEVYCIGLTLYELLAAQPAFANTSPTQIFKLIATQSPTPLRQVDILIPRDLETIVQKATDKSPANRYPSAAELRDDLNRFLEDRPIKARPISRMEKAMRWSRRNPLIASFASLSAVLLFVVAFVSSAAYFSTSDAYHKLGEKHAALIDQQKETETAKGMAEQNALRAKQNEAQMRIESERAEGNVDLAIQAFDDLFRKIMSKGAGRDLKSNMELEAFAELSSIGTLVTKDDAKILESVIRFYREFTEKNEDNDELKIEIAKAFRRIANIYHLTGELNLAEEGYRKACRMYAAIVRDDVEDVDSVINLAECQNELAVTYRKNNKPLASLNEHRSAMRLLQSEPYSTLESCRYILAGTLIYLGTFGEGGTDDLANFPSQKSGGPHLRETRRADAKRRSMDRFSNEKRGYGNRPSGKPADGILGDRRPFSRNNSANLEVSPRLRDWGMIKTFRQSCLRRAEEIADSLYRTDKNNGAYRLLRAQVYRSKAAAVGVNGERRWQTVQLRQAISELENLQKDFPNQPLYRFVLAQTLAIDVQNSDGQYLVKMKARGAEICSSLMEEFPMVIEYVDLAAVLNEQLATFYLESEPGRAEDCFQETQRLLLKLIGEVPRVKSYSMRYANASLVLVDLLGKEKMIGAAERELKSLIAFVQRPSFPRGSKKLELLESCRERLRKIRRE